MAFRKLICFKQFSYRFIFILIIVLVLYNFFVIRCQWSQNNSGSQINQGVTHKDIGGWSLLVDYLRGKQMMHHGKATQSGTNTAWEAMEDLVDKNVPQDDPNLLNVIRSLMVAPSNQEQAFAGTFYRTPQVNAVMGIFKNKRNGVFIECGAFDGETSSNTAFLEYEMGWTGLLVEMTPMTYLQLLGKNRNAYSINACLSTTNHPKTETFTYFGQETRIYKGQGPKKIDVPSGNHIKLERPSFTVPCFPLASLLYAIDMVKIDYFSLDIEGLELEVLWTIPWSKLDITVLSVEYKHSKHTPTAMKSFMEQRGYDLYTELNVVQADRLTSAQDFIFVKKNYEK